MLDAPKEYPELANDVGALYGVLRSSHEHFVKNPKHDKISKLKRIVGDTQSVLGDLKKVQEKFHKCRGVWDRARWAIERPRLLELRARVNEKITLLSYCRTGIEL